MDIETLRDEFRKMEDAACYEVPKSEWRDAVKSILPENPTPSDWVDAARNATVVCPRCDHGTYYWGAVINGRPSHSGDCYRCGGTGRQGMDDFHRNRAYDRHAIVAAFAS